MPARPSRFVPLLLAVSFAASALPAATARADPGSGLPSFAGSVTSREYDGRDDDLLTAGLGFAGLRRAIPRPSRPRPSHAGRAAAVGRVGGGGALRWRRGRAGTAVRAQHRRRRQTGSR
ncbi:3-hydroxybutyrate oligomer hydrolase family protein [Streptomyces afghaniensis]|uniref:3-hydroxybutyrate oligomer hydrolase family protein n=1 Tax=Streptomyces afghaniensis TaxID=66865 RepID=UPI0006882976|nr:3-hydroxybutyrate oligomer hydrolase family protein [Streptomyces afghaniensis]